MNTEEEFKAAAVLSYEIKSEPEKFFPLYLYNKKEAEILAETEVRYCLSIKQ